VWFALFSCDFKLYELLFLGDVYCQWVKAAINTVLSLVCLGSACFFVDVFAFWWIIVDHDHDCERDGVVLDGSAGAVNGHTSSAAAMTDVDSAVAGPSSSAHRDISRVDRDVIRLIAQHLQNLGLKYATTTFVSVRHEHNVQRFVSE